MQDIPESEKGGFGVKWAEAAEIEQRGTEDGVGKSFLKLLLCVARTLCNVPGSVVAVKLEENEAELLNPDPLSTSNKTWTIKSGFAKPDRAGPDLEDGEIPEGEADDDYVESEDVRSRGET